MSDLLTQLQVQLQRFDDDALAALANRGLLRRAQKDLEKLAPAIAEDSATGLVVSVGEHRIRFDARGPAQAQCSCPASSICQHILAAMIALQRMAPAEPPAPAPQAAGPLTEDDRKDDPKEAREEPAVANEPAPDDALAPLHEALLQIGAAEMTRHGGTRGYRWAVQFVHDLDPNAGPAISGSKYIVIRFAHPRVEFRYMGGALDNLIADVSLSAIEKYQVAAVLAYQRAHGIELPAPASTSMAKAGNAVLNLGKDHALPETAGEQFASRKRLRESVRQLIEECVGLGLSHLSNGIHERFSTLSVWAQGVEYHRLALLIRRLADHVELLLARAGGADEHRLLDELALAYGLASALDRAAARGLEATHLLGRARSRYAQGGAVELLGLGARPWRSASGYVGLSTLFWSSQDGSFFSSSDARPETQRRFNPRERYRTAGPWTGIGAPAQLTGRRVLLTGAQFNEQGRISAGQGSSATLLPQEAAARFAAALSACDDWSSLAASRALIRRSLLLEQQPMKDWIVLRPARYGTARFEATRQTLTWPVFDHQDRQLDIELVYSDMAAHAIARIEQMRPEQLTAGTMLVAMLRNDMGRLSAEPLSLVRPHAVTGEAAVDALYFDEAPEAAVAARVRALQQQVAASGDRKAIAQGMPSIVPRALREVRDWIQRQAERGVSPEGGGEVLARITELNRRTGDAGMSMFGKLASGANVAMNLLRMHYLCMQYEHLLGGGQGEGGD
ncbi:SWIM zinc finger family protein [Herbaspirillum sp. NPDC087042]|uniref:SWIM zinc finger family protein n=1 Tax=Herbaspirillum sp. NPDC087042 TaxID=3364004 RepID=UPI003815EC47